MDDLAFYISAFLNGVIAGLMLSLALSHL